MITWIHELSPEGAKQAGAKLSRPAELVRAGVEVPSGFVVPTSAYLRFLDQSGIAAAIDVEVSTLIDAEDVDALTLQSQHIQALFDCAAFDTETTEQITEAWMVEKFCRTMPFASTELE